MTNPQIDRLRKAVERAHERVGGVSIERMGGDNLAVTLCSHFEDGEGDNDDYGWGEAATSGYEETVQAIRDHYQPVFDAFEAAYRALLAKIAELEGERDEARDVIREVIRAAGGAAHPECSMEFLKLAPAEVAAMKSLLAERDAASARVGVLEEALEPFAKLAGPINGEEDRPTYLESIEGKHGTGELYLGTHFGTDRYLTMWTEDFVRARLARGEG